MIPLVLALLALTTTTTAGIESAPGPTWTIHDDVPTTTVAPAPTWTIHDEPTTTVAPAPAPTLPTATTLWVPPSDAPRCVVTADGTVWLMLDDDPACDQGVAERVGHDIVADELVHPAPLVAAVDSVVAAAGRGEGLGDTDAVTVSEVARALCAGGWSMMCEVTG